MGFLFCQANDGRSAVSRLTAVSGRFFLALVVLGLVRFPAAAQSAPNGNAVVPSRVVNAVDPTRLVQLKGNTHPMARAQFDQGQVASSTRMERMILVLQRSEEQEQALTAFNARQQDPSSPDYHHWLEPDEFGKLYGPSDADMAAVTSWLLNSGFTIDDVSKGRTTIEFTGTAAQVQAAFHTEMHHYLVSGKMQIANDRDPSIPEALSPVVNGINSLNSFERKSQAKLGRYVRRDKATGAITEVAPPAGVVAVHANQEKIDGELEGGTTGNGPLPQFGFTYSNVTYEDLTPYDFATIYNVLPLWNASTPITGSGVSVAITGRTDITVSDFNTFRSSFGLPASTLQTIVNGADPGIVSGDNVENTLDVEMVSAAAPGAQVILVSSKSTNTTDGVDLSASYVIDHKTAPIMSTSYGLCEFQLGATANAFYNNLYQQGATEGISIFVSQGDEGSAGCADTDKSTPYGDTLGLGVNGLSSTPYNTAVGGTDLTWGFQQNGQTTYWNTTNGAQLQSAKGYIPEMPWNTTCTNPRLIAYLGNSSVTTEEQVCNFLVGRNGSDLIQVSAGGGGVSNCTMGSTNNSTLGCTGGYAKPTWQTGIGVPSDGKRDVPDVSMFAAYGFPNSIPSSAILFCYAAGSPDSMCDYTNPNYTIYQEIGGTSAASPYLAGVMALVVQKTGASQGLANPTFYSLARTQASNGTACDSSTGTTGNGCVFNDISSGTIAQVCVSGDPNCVTSTSGDQFGVLSGYAAGVGYDRAVGLGSVNVSNLVNAWPTTSTGVAVTVTPSSLSFPSTAMSTTSSTTGTVTVKNTGSVAVAFQSVTFMGTNAGSFSQTTTCSTTTPLAAGGSCTVTVSFTPSSTGTLSGTLNVQDDAGTQMVSLSGTGATASLVVGVAPTSLMFGAVTVGNTSAAQTVTVTNSGNESITFSGFNVGGTNASAFAITTNTCGMTLAANANCAVSVVFQPAASGTLSGTLSVADNATGSPQTVTLSGTGTATTATATLASSSLTFASTTVNATSGVKMATLTNTGTTPLTIATGGIMISGANASLFNETTTCGAMVAAGANCTISVTFSPTSAGAFAATLSVSDNATGTPQMVALSGTGVAAVPAATLSSGSLTFPSTTLGSSSASQTVTLTNSGNAALSIAGITLGGANASSFADTTTCGTTLAASANCMIAVSFKPAASGAAIAVLNVADNATGSPQTVMLSGTGAVAPTTTTLTTSLGTAGVGASVTFTATVQGSGITPSGTVTFSSGTTSLGTGTLNGSGVATLTTSFPTAGTYSVTAVYGGSATTGASTSAAVAETVVTVGVTVSVAPSPLTITRGGMGMLTITVTPSGGYTGTVGLSCGTLPAYVTCSFNPTTLTLTGTTAVTDVLTINTSVTTTAKLESPMDEPEPSATPAVAGVWLPGAVLAFVGLNRRKRLSLAARRLLLLVVLCVGLGGAAMLSGCGGGSASTTAGGTTTTTTTNTAAAGTYTVPIALTLGAGGTSQTVSASVVIQ